MSDMENRETLTWRERLEHWSRRGGFLTSRQDVEDLVAPLAQRLDAVERELKEVRAEMKNLRDG